MCTAILQFLGKLFFFCRSDVIFDERGKHKLRVPPSPKTPTKIGNLKRLKPFLTLYVSRARKSLFSALFPSFIYRWCVCVPDPPQVVLSLGSTLNAEGIKEGDDVYFECNIKANPKQHKITWYRNVSIFSFVSVAPTVTAVLCYFTLTSLVCHPEAHF